ETTTRDFTNLGVYAGTKDPITGAVIDDASNVLSAFRDDVANMPFIVWANATNGTGTTGTGAGTGGAKVTPIAEPVDNAASRKTVGVIGGAVIAVVLLAKALF
ncbi:hypothetical protein HK104_007897, partial [Borealophlyctis nickersoniae]